MSYFDKLNKSLEKVFGEMDWSLNKLKATCNFKKLPNDKWTWSAVIPSLDVQVVSSAEFTTKEAANSNFLDTFKKMFLNIQVDS